MTSLHDFFAAIPSKLRRRTASGRYRPEIDGLRFWAIAIVVYGHLAERVQRFAGGDNPVIWFLAHPQGGVFLFFAISGFIIVSQFLRMPGKFLTAEHLKSYFGRRVLRIEPPYLLLLIATYLVIQFLHISPPRMERFQAQPASLTVSLLASLLYSHGWLFGALPRLFPPGWSLEIEIQFYLIAPFVFALYLSMAGKTRVMFGALVMVATICLAMWVPTFWPPEHSRLSLVAHFPFFWIGVLFATHQAAVGQWASRRSAAFAAAVGFGGLAVFVIVGAMLTPGLWVDLARMLIQSAAIAMMFVAVAHPANGFRTVCSMNWISLIGGACYSTYLTHLQVLQVASLLVVHTLPHLWPQGGAMTALVLTALIGVPLVLIVGLCVYATIERFFMRADWPQVVLAVVRGRRAAVART